MAAGVLFVIPILVLLFAVLGVAMFWDAAMARGRTRTLASRLPLVSGGELQEWGVAEGRWLVQRWLKAERVRPDGASLFTGARGLLDRVLGQAWGMPAHQAAPVPCNPRFETGPRVNVPEALGIVDELNRRPAGIRTEVIDQARENLSRRSRLGAAPPACPLLLKNGFCACSSARPLTCRGRCCVGLEAPPGGEAWARKLGEAIDSGIEEELRAQHMDAARYDMNEVVLTLLEHPGVSERWSRGERVLDDACANACR